jgi:sigma-B regulation protein RsbU (phosphoserine phosphatase)
LFHFSLRAKIIALVGGALTLSLLSYVFMGTRLLVGDKISYIYDFDSAQVKASTSSLEAMIRGAVSASRVTASLLRGPGSLAAAEKAYPSLAEGTGLRGLLLLRPSGDDHFAFEAAFGATRDSLLGWIDPLGWTPAALRLAGTLVAAIPTESTVAVGTAAFDAAGNPVACIALVTLSESLFGEVGTELEFRVLDGSGRVILGRAPAGRPKLPAARELELELLRGEFGSGARDARVGATDVVAAYRRVEPGRLLIVGYLPRELALRAARTLAYRSIALGLGVLLVGVGFALVFVRSLTERIRELWQATLRVARGDFRVRVSAPAAGRDELSDLAGSFNTMAGRIEKLVAETAENARMSKELETARLVQARFFPEADFQSENLVVSGRLAPATECAGDWWHYGAIGKQCLIFVGDVTGHGVSAALVTGAVHGAFNLLMRQLAENPERGIELGAVIGQLNRAVIDAARGEASMTFAAALIDLAAGELTLATAEHPAPLLHRATAGGSPTERFLPLLTPVASALGHSPEFRMEIIRQRLEPGDTLLIYTDGLLENRKSDHRRMSRTALLKTFTAALEGGGGGEAGGTCDRVMKNVQSFFGENANDRLDDITVVVGTIPRDARFERRAAA